MIVAIVMLRDEADILPAWLRHMAALCDRILVVDHRSTDGSSEILHHVASAGVPIRVWRMEEPGHWQSDVTTELAKFAFQEGADWVLPFDVDEFVEIESKEKLETLLRRQNHPLVFWRWRHLSPQLNALKTGQFDLFADSFIANPKPADSWLGKVALERTVFQKLPSFRLGHGNHKVHGTAFAKAMRGKTIGTLWHLPVRSREQMIRKLSRDVASYSNSRGGALPELEGAVPLKRQLLQKISENPDDLEVLQRMGLGYWEKGLSCLNDPDILRSAVMVSPTIARANLPPHLFNNVTLGRVDSSPASARLTTHALVQARLTDTRVEIQAAGLKRALSYALERNLTRYFTPGLRLARFFSTRFVTARLGVTARSED